MAEFKITLQKTLAHEGGYVNDPDDAGGETYKGISRANHPNWKGWSIIDLAKSISTFPGNLLNNVELQKQVELFYLYEFWIPMKADLLSNQTSCDSIFAFAVNTGMTTSIRIVQSIVGTNVDGIVGVKTLSKINSMDFGYFQAALTVAKLKYYLHVIRRRPTNKKFLLGWISRSLSFND